MKLVLLMFGAFSLVLLGAVETNNTTIPSQDIEIRRAEKRAEIAKRAGGYARKTDMQKGRVVFANAQKDVAEDILYKAAQYIGESVKMAVDLVKYEGTNINSRSTNEFLSKAKANAVIYIVSTADDDPILISPEERWAKINVYRLKGKDIEIRTRKEMIRTFVFLFGGGTSDIGHPLLGAITNLEKLDSAPGIFPQDVLGRLESYLGQLGVTTYYQTTYRRACRMGWAPAPTNDLQKAIWEKVKAEKEKGPTSPLKIVPPNAKK